MAQTIKVGRRTINVSNLDKVLFPDDGITKGDLIAYYEAVGDRMLPEADQRLLTMERFPDGIAKQRFFQKEISDYFPEWIDRQSVPKRGGRVNHVVVHEKATLVYLANQACVTMHTGLSKRDRIDHPDTVIFDLDPSVDDFGLIRRTALRFRELLDDLGLFSVVKTSGSRGLHVTIPLSRKEDFSEVRSFAHDVAAYMASQHPEELTIEGRKEKRGDRLYLDWMRNSFGAHAVAPYTVRARAGAPVAMPIEWAEVEDRKLTAQRYRLPDVAKRISDMPDPWKAWRRRARSIKEPRRRLDALRSG